MPAHGARSVPAAALHPTGRVAALAAVCPIILWEFSTGAVLKRWDAYVGAVTAVQFAENGKLLLTGGDDAKVKLWNPTDGNRLVEVKGNGIGRAHV